jgi:transposase-like protein
MFGRETRMLVRHYLEHGKTKSALAREFGVSRDTVGRPAARGDSGRRLVVQRPSRHGSIWGRV